MIKLFIGKAVVAGAFLLAVSGCVRPTPPTATALPTQINPAEAEANTLEGKWDYTMSNPDQAPFSGTWMVQRGGAAGYTGWISISTIDYEAQTKVTKADIQGNHFTYAGEVQTRQGSYPFELSGTINGNKMTGQNKVKTEDGPVIFNVTATRK
jgi:hypothetical protein